MSKSKTSHMILQSAICSNYDITSICSCNREVVTSPTSALLHQQSRFFIICEGVGKIKIQGSVYDLKKGSLVSILPYQYSEITEVSEPLLFDLVIYNFDLFNEIVKIHLNFFNEDISLIELFRKNNVTLCDNESFEDVHQIFCKLQNELGTESLNIENKRKHDFSGIFISAKILELISIFERQVSLMPKSVDSDYDHHDLIIQYIYLNLNGKTTLKDLSKIFYMSESAISSYIYNKTGLSYSDLVYQMKIARIKNFLIYTNMNLDELAEVLGYTDAAHISKAFTNETDQHISLYRRTYKKINRICKSKESKVSYEIVDYIFNNYYLDLHAANVAEKFNISVVDLNYHLKYLVEKNFDCFLNYVRINKSVKLLLDTNKSISSIANEVGYMTVRTYNRNFKRFYNINPAKFRQQVSFQKNNNHI